MTDKLEFHRVAIAPDYVAGSDGRIVKVRGRGTADRDIPMRAHDSGSGNGYLKVRLVVPGEGRRMFYVHRLVCEAFHGLPPDYVDGDAQARHLNGEPTDNRAANLAWGTQSANERDKDRYSRR
jgi:hypothetical protein